MKSNLWTASRQESTMACAASFTSPPTRRTAAKGTTREDATSIRRSNRIAPCRRPAVGGLRQCEARPENRHHRGEGAIDAERVAPTSHKCDGWQLRPRSSDRAAKRIGTASSRAGDDTSVGPESAGRQLRPLRRPVDDPHHGRQRHREFTHAGVDVSPRHVARHGHLAGLLVHQRRRGRLDEGHRRPRVPIRPELLRLRRRHPHSGAIPLGRQAGTNARSTTTWLSTAGDTRQL
jgi:hypothetical protein